MARISFANGLKADPGNPFVCHAWGLMEQRDGDNERAREILEVPIFDVYGVYIFIHGGSDGGTVAVLVLPASSFLRRSFLFVVV